MRFQFVIVVLCLLWTAGSVAAQDRPDVATPPIWSHVAPRRETPPETRDRGWPRDLLDAFVLARLEKESLTPSAAADRAILRRRLSLDLLGLPPTPEEVDEFVADPSPDAYERVVDRLLASDQFGIRWARPWLDYGRYADSHGFQRDDFRDLWAYRDWVVNALNADLPFDQFTVEQLAGDLLPNPTLSQQIATGFQRAAPCNVEAGSDPEETRVNQVHDRVHTLGAVWLGTTLECCQCHDHKYDPFTMRDYYGLFAFFNSTAAEAERANPRTPGSIRFVGPSLDLGDDSLGEHAVPPGAALRGSTQPETPPRKSPRPTTQVMRELREPRQTMIFERGDFRSPEAPVEPDVPSCLPPIDAAASRPNRLTLARWLVRDDHPLVARVAVNRLWAELFGRGIVATLEDFGVKGERPTHPELLDHLACDFRDRGWSTKRLLRDVVCSSTYRQSSRVTADQAARDDQNVFLARISRLRLDAEAIRDNALAIAGLLCPRRGGPPIRPYQPAGLWVKVGGEKYEYAVSPGDEQYRRGLYVVWKRAAPYPSFMNFDATNRMTCRVRRTRTNTPLQALTLLNDPVYVEAALALADRIVRDVPDGSLDERLVHGFRLAVARQPSPREVSSLRNLYETQLLAAAAAPDQTRSLVGGRSLPAGAAASELAAWYAVATTLLNLDETISRR